jgi:hypothetical protein
MSWCIGKTSPPKELAEVEKICPPVWIESWVEMREDWITKSVHGENLEYHLGESSE